MLKFITNTDTFFEKDACNNIEKEVMTNRRKKCCIGLRTFYPIFGYLYVRMKIMKYHRFAVLLLLILLLVQAVPVLQAQEVTPEAENPFTPPNGYKSAIAG
jgi:hypothetical protein